MKTHESMAEMKEEIIQLLGITHDELVLSEVRQLLQQPATDWWDELSDEEKAAVDRAEADIVAGRVFAHAEVKADLEKWLKE
jgi:hypothetical protein